VAQSITWVMRRFDNPPLLVWQVLQSGAHDLFDLPLVTTDKVSLDTDGAYAYSAPCGCLCKA
jgi:hypothetical protein